MKEKKVIGEVNTTKNSHRSSTCNECEQAVDGVSIKEIDKIYPCSSIQEDSNFQCHQMIERMKVNDEAVTSNRRIY